MILFGGNSSEYEVSCLSAAGVAKNIDLKKYNLLMVGIDKNNNWLFTKASLKKIENGEWVRDESNVNVTLSLNHKYPGLLVLDKKGYKSIDVDCIFPILHGHTGEDGSIQGVLQLSGIPYIGCGIQSSVMGFDKALTKEIVKTINVSQAKSYILYKDNSNQAKRINDICNFFENIYPLFVKPAREGSSVGISKVNNFDELSKAIELGFVYDSKLVIEESIIGREIEVAILGNENAEASSIGEIITDDDFYSYDAKYKSDKSKTRIISDLSNSKISNIKNIALRIYKVLECKDLARVDFFLKKDGEIVFNEINTMPGFTPISMYPKLWDSCGINYSELISKLIENVIRY